MKDLRTYDLVVMSHATDATIFRVKEMPELDGVMVGLINASLEHGPLQWFDESLLLRPTRLQLESHNSEKLG